MGTLRRPSFSNFFQDLVFGRPKTDACVIGVSCREKYLSKGEFMVELPIVTGL